MAKTVKVAKEIQEEGGLLPAFLLLGLWAAFLLAPDTQLLDLKRALGFAWVAAAVLVLALRLAQGKPTTTPPLRLGLLLAILLVAYKVAAQNSPYSQAGFFREEALALGVLLALFATCLPEAVRLHWSTVTLWSAAAISVYALVQRLGVDPVEAYRLAGSQVRATGPFGNATFLAAFLCFVWPLVLLWHDRRRPALALLFLLALLATQSRAGILALLVQLGVLGLQAWKEGLRPRLGPWAIGTLLALAAVFWLFPWANWLRPTLRLPLWSESLHLSLQRPWLGWGPGSFALALQDHGSAAFNTSLGGGQFAESPHNWFLSVFHEAGLLGLAAWGLLFASTQPWPRLNARRSPLQRALALGLFGLLVQNLFDRNLDQAALGSCFFFGLGLLYQDEVAPRSMVRPRWQAFLYLGLAIVFAWMGLRPVLAYRRAVGLDTGPSGVSDLDELRRKVAVDPNDIGDQDRLGAGLAAAGKFDEAAEHFRIALRLQASAGRAQNLGNSLMELGKADEAEAMYRQALVMAPKSADLHFDLGYALFGQKKLKAAVEELDQALALDPDHASAAKLKEQILR